MSTRVRWCYTKLQLPKIYNAVSYIVPVTHKPVVIPVYDYGNLNVLMLMFSSVGTQTDPKLTNNEFPVPLLSSTPKKRKLAHVVQEPDLVESSLSSVEMEAVDLQDKTYNPSFMEDSESRY